MRVFCLVAAVVLVGGCHGGFVTGGVQNVWPALDTDSSFDEVAGAYVATGSNDAGVGGATGVVGDFGVNTDGNSAWAELNIEPPTISVGVAELSGESVANTDSEELVRQADVAMYRAKRRGGDAVEAASP